MSARNGQPELVTKRVYEAPAKSDGTRILIDRLWPRGLSKEKARVDYWAKDAAPSIIFSPWSPWAHWVPLFCGSCRSVGRSRCFWSSFSLPCKFP